MNSRNARKESKDHSTKTHPRDRLWRRRINLVSVAPQRPRIASLLTNTMTEQRYREAAAKCNNGFDSADRIERWSFHKDEARALAMKFRRCRPHHRCHSPACPQCAQAELLGTEGISLKVRSLQLQVASKRRLGENLGALGCGQCGFHSRPTAKWFVQFRHLELSSEYEIKLGFLTRSGKRDTIIVPARDRSEFEKIRRELCARDARLSMDRKVSLQFVERLIQATPKYAVEVVSKPGFRDGANGFVIPARRYGSSKGCFRWDANFSDPVFGEIKGDLAQYRGGVLKPALASPFVSSAILIALAAPLCSYTEQKDGRGKLLSEAAIFHFAGESSSGKTTLARITQLVFGSPNITTDYEATPRGVAEAAYARNDLVVTLDDTENSGLGDRELLNFMKFFAQRLVSGRSKAIAKAAGGCFSVSHLVLLRSQYRAGCAGRDRAAHWKQEIWRACSVLRSGCASQRSGRHFWSYAKRDTRGDRGFRRGNRQDRIGDHRKSRRPPGRMDQIPALEGSIGTGEVACR